MRKKTISCLFDSFMWYVIYLLPLIIFVISWCTSSEFSISTIMTMSGFEILSNNFVFTALNSIFGVDGILPIFASTDVLMYMTYFICVMILHLAVDVLLFIVRLCHEWIDSFGGKLHD